MDAIVEKRSSFRVNVNCKLYCKPVRIPQVHEILCINLSCSGISFLSDQDFQIGEEIEVRINTEFHVAPKVHFFIKIVRSERQQDGKFKIGATIDYKDDEYQDS